MALGLTAAYSTVPSDFHVHHITTQFVQPGAKDTTLTFDVTRSSDSKNNAARIVFISQLGTRISMMTIDFIRRPILDGLSLNYQTQFPEGIEPPDDEINDMKFLGKGLLHAHILGRVMSECSVPSLNAHKTPFHKPKIRTGSKKIKPANGWNLAAYRLKRVGKCTMLA